MKKLFTILSLFITANIYSQVMNVDSLKATINDHQSKFEGIEERLATDESDLSKLNKIKLSGYIQSQWVNYEDKNVYPNNYFMVKRARVKTTYDAADGVKFVLMPDFAPGNIGIKDCYAQLNDHWLHNENLKNMLSLWVGKFNRCDYEVEYSSSQMEALERSKIIQTLYPSELAVGAKLEINPPKIPIHFQLALLNGAEQLTIKDSAGNALYSTPNYQASPNNENIDFDNYKDIMARLTYNIKLGNFGGLDLGVHTYLGQLKSNTTQTLKSDYTTTSNIKLGDPLKRDWYGAELQFYADVLGGMAIKGEYLAGNNATVGNIGTSTAKTITPNFQNKFAGYYVYFIKNIGKKNQFVFRYDFYDPNTDISGSDIGVKKYSGGTDPVTGKKINSYKSGKNDIAYATYTIAWQYYFDSNIKLSLGYNIVQNEKVGKTTAGVGNVTSSYTLPNGTSHVDDFSKVVDQNMLTIRVQASF